ncbi:MAG: hypothetical protein KBE22_07935 [Candidatus Accumulibacter sp.]|nr:hypothetical protein [Accumulibacter sp.]
MTRENDKVDDSMLAPEAEGSRPPSGAQTVSLAIRLQPVEHSEQPVFANFTTVQTGSGVVFIDFGFLEPQTMAMLARLGQPGVKIPEAIGGNLACRMALSLETTANLANQLTQLLRNATAAQAQRAQAAMPAIEEEQADPIH